MKGEKLLIAGVNGAGKSTLLKLIAGKLKPNQGEIILNDKTTIGYYAQEHELLDNDKTILENVNDNDLSEIKLRNILGRFLFFGDDVFKKVSVLSPGEKARVSFAKLSLMGANTLLLDEPTNHLDVETQEIIANFFKDFKGNLLVVSHSLSFIKALNIEKVLILPSGKISEYKPEIMLKYKEEE
jgi:ATP-binding cassette subfamily F protein 3